MKTIIIGGAATGMGVAAKLKRLDPQHEILVLQEQAYVSLGACGLPYFIGDHVSDPNALIARKIADFKQQGIEIINNTKVEKVDFKNQQIVFNNQTQTYDNLVIATGATPVIPALKNVDAHNIFTVHSQQDAIAIKAQLRSKMRVVVIGSGLIGLEMVENIKEAVDAYISVVEKAERVLANIFDEEFTDQVEAVLHNHKIELYKNSEVSEFLVNAHHQVTGVKLHDGTHLVCDLVILAIGVRPNTDFLVNQGLAMDARHNIIINEYCETNIPNVYAGGDCATTNSYLYPNQRNFYLATVANKHAKVIAHNLYQPRSQQFYGGLGTTIMRFFSLQLARSGENAAFFKQHKIPTQTVLIKDKDHTNYLPDQQDLWLKLVVDQTTNTIVNCQMSGANHAVMRIYGVITMMWGKLPVDELLAQIDLPYAPPFSKTTDIIHLGLSKLVNK